jgi:hypothetical protein
VREGREMQARKEEAVLYYRALFIKARRKEERSGESR